ncbi:unnamed protein product [Ixodes pacificus]
MRRVCASSLGGDASHGKCILYIFCRCCSRMASWMHRNTQGARRLWLIGIVFPGTTA